MPMLRNPLLDIAVTNTRQSRQLSWERDTSPLYAVIRELLKASGLEALDTDDVNVSSPSRGIQTRRILPWLGGAPSWCGNEHIGLPPL